MEEQHHQSSIVGAPFYSPTSTSGGAAVARPKTRNPHMQEALVHSEASSLMDHQELSMGSTGNVSPTNHSNRNTLQSLATGGGGVAPMHHHALQQHRGSLSHEHEGVLWSEAGDDIPTSSLVRPGTSNPKLRETMTPVRHNHTPPTAGHHAGPVESDSPVMMMSNTATAVGPTCSTLQPQTNTTHNQLQHQQLSSGHVSHGEAPPDQTVLWAAEGAEVDPAIVARPLTSNPWLSRVIDSSNGEDEEVVAAAAAGRSPGGGRSIHAGIGSGGKAVISGGGGSESIKKQTSSKSPSASQGGGASLTKQSSEILWSSGNVDDWRMLARPHAANPTYERAQEVHSGVDDSEGGPPTANLTRRVSEVLWKRDETADEVVQGQRLRIEELEREVALLRAQLIHQGLSPATALPMNYSGQQQEYQSRNYYIQPQEREALAAAASAVASSSVDSSTATATALAQRQHQELQQLHYQQEGHRAHVHYEETQVQKTRDAVLSDMVAAATKKVRPQSAGFRRPGALHNPSTTQNRSIPGREVDDSGDSSACLIQEDDTPDEEMDPELLGTPQPKSSYTNNTSYTTRTATNGNNGHGDGDVVVVSSAAASNMNKRSFVSKLTQEVQGGGAQGGKVRPGTAQPSRSSSSTTSSSSRAITSKDRTTTRNSYYVPRISGQSTVGTGNSNANGGGLALGGGPAIGSIPHPGFGLHRPMSAPLQRGIVSSPTKGSVSLMNCTSLGVARTISTTGLASDEDSQMLMEFENMKRPGAEYVEKVDFAESYTRRAAEYGCTVSSREMERMLRPYRVAGPELLTADEFSILFLKLQQW